MEHQISQFSQLSSHPDPTIFYRIVTSAPAHVLIIPASQLVQYTWYRKHRLFMFRVTVLGRLHRSLLAKFIPVWATYVLLVFRRLGLNWDPEKVRHEKAPHDTSRTGK